LQSEVLLVIDNNIRIKVHDYIPFTQNKSILQSAKMI